MRIGAHAPVQGFTDRAKQTAVALNATVFVWTPACGPQDAALFPSALHIVRLDNWAQGMAPSSYVQSVTATVTKWRSVIPDAVFQCGNEPDIVSGHSGENFPLYAAAMRATLPGVRLANPPLSVSGTKALTPTICAAADFVACHSYWERQHPEDITNEGLGASYRIAMRAAGTKPTIVTEFNVVQTNCPIDWPDRNAQAAAWLDQAEGDGVAGAAFFILDAAPDWASFDVGPEAAADILAHRKGVVPPPPTGAYSGNSDPRHDLPLAAGWQAMIAKTNATDAAAIVQAYSTFAPTIHYDANLALAQAYHETGGFDCSKSPAWCLRRNPAGLGITGNNVAGPNFGTVERGVQAHLALLNCYYGDGKDPWGVLTSFGMGGMTLGKTTLNGMNGVWAVPGDGYGDAIAVIANQVIGGVVPPPVPPPPTSGVTGDDVIDLVRRYIGQGASDNTLDPWNKPHVWGGWCEALFDGICYTLNIDEVHRGTALQKGDAVEAEGLAQTSWPPEHGAGVCYGANFDVQGHITFWDADMGQFLGTLLNPSNIGYHAATGAWLTEMRCWFRLPGVVAARRSTPPPPVVDNLVIPGNPYNVGRAEADRYGVGGAIRTFWESLANPFAVLGWPMANEVTAIVTNEDKTATARTVQKFERSWVVFAPEAPDDWKVTLALLNQKIAVITP